LRWIYKIVRKVESFGDDLEGTKENVSTIMNNHIPHLQAELEDVNGKLNSVNENIVGLRGDVKDGFSRLTDSLNLILVGRLTS
jgi:hypothetical protein